MAEPASFHGIPLLGDIDQGPEVTITLSTGRQIKGRGPDFEILYDQFQYAEHAKQALKLLHEGIGAVYLNQIALMRSLGVAPIDPTKPFADAGARGTT